jgi:hypothetical protein
MEMIPHTHGHDEERRDQIADAVAVALADAVDCGTVVILEVCLPGCYGSPDGCPLCEQIRCQPNGIVSHETRGH